MDFKGIKWMGNIYQKFEAMCLEMEEVMYQDSVKYVENQAQKVGGCVKRFYSEVVEDLIPPSCGGPFKISSGDLSLNPCADPDIDKKPLPSVCDSGDLLKKNMIQDKIIPDLSTEKGLSPCRNSDMKSLSRLSLGELNQNKSYESTCGKIKKLGACRRSIGIRRISQNKDLSKESSRTSSLHGDRSINLASCDTRSNSVIASATAASEVMPSLNLDEKLGAGAVEETQIESLDSEKKVSAEPARLEAGNLKCISSASDNNTSSEPLTLKRDSEHTTTCQGLSIESTGSSIRNSGCSLESVNKAAAPSAGKSEKDGVQNTDTDAYDTEFRDEHDISDEDNYGLEVIEPIMGSKSEANLDMSCVMVEAYEFDGDDTQVKRRKSYKKRLCKAVSSKLRLTRKKENCGGERSINNATITEERNLRGRECESLGSDDWELV